MLDANIQAKDPIIGAAEAIRGKGINMYTIPNVFSSNFDSILWSVSIPVRSKSKEISNANII